MDYSYTTSTVDTATAWAVIMSMVGFFLFVAVVSYVIMSFILSRIFKKAGIEEWIAWVPIYNTWKMLEIGGQPGWWSVLAIVPLVNIVSVVMIYIAMYNISLKLGKEGAFILWAIFIPIVWYLWLAFDTSVWDDSKGSPRLDTSLSSSNNTAQTSQSSSKNHGSGDSSQTPPTA